MISAIDAFSLVAFMVFLVGGTVRVVARVIYYRRHHFRQPELLGRDLLLVGGLALSLGATLVVRVAIQQGLIGGERFREGGDLAVPFRLLTVIPSLVAVGAFAFFEWFRIERRQVDPDREPET